MQSTFSKIWTAALDLVYPSRCFGCNKEGAFICPDCVSELVPALPPRCQRCWRRSASPVCNQCKSIESSVQAIRSAFIHDGLAREAVLELKYHGVSAAGQAMGELMAEATTTMAFETIVPVPLHRSRQRRRGYNQAAKLALGLGSALALPVETSLLRRAKATREQAAGLGYQERLVNVEGAFTVPDPTAVADRAILLVDDVVTTGATMQACGRALEEAGAAAVYGVSFTREG